MGSCLLEHLLLLDGHVEVGTHHELLTTRTYYHKYRLFTIRAIISKWAPPNENLTATYIANVSRLTGIAPDEPIGIPSDQPARWMMLGVAMAIQENGTDSLDYFAMLKGWTLARDST